MKEIDRAIAVLEYAGRADLAKAIEQQTREIQRQRRGRKRALKAARRFLAGCRLLDYSDTERAPAGAVKSWMKQWAVENDRAVAAESRLAECEAIAFEAGYCAREKGKNLQMALSELAALRPANEEKT